MIQGSHPELGTLTCLPSVYSVQCKGPEAGASLVLVTVSEVGRAGGDWMGHRERALGMLCGSRYSEGLGEGQQGGLNMSGKEQ